MSMLDDQAPVRDPQDGRLIGHYVLVGDDARHTFFDPADAKVWNAVTAAFPGDRVQLESWSADRKKIGVRVDSATEGPAYAVVDLASVEQIDSAGLGCLVAALKRTSEAGGDLKIARLQKRPRLVFEITRSHRVFEIFDSVEEAMGAAK